MKKLGLGTVGTSQITEQFIQAAKQSDHYKLEAIYSRTLEKAEQFKERFEAQTTYTDWEAFLNDPRIDVIYIASPNSLHFKQGLEAARHGKHLIIEKPIVVSTEEWEELMAVGRENKVVIVEAARHIFEPNFIEVSRLIRDSYPIYGADLTYSKYSSRYDDVLQGEEPAIFSPTFGGGAANDLGIYVIYAALEWFGKPESVHAFSQKIRTGVDGKGTTILRYADFDVTLNYGKMNTSLNGSEVYTKDHTIVLDAITGVEQVEIMDARTRESKAFALPKPADNPLIDEAIAFAQVMQEPESEENKAKLNEWTTLSKDVHQVLDQIRLTL